MIHVRLILRKGRLFHSKVLNLSSILFSSFFKWIMFQKLRSCNLMFEKRTLCFGDYTCDWIKFVRLAKEPSEANLIVFQQRGCGFFSTIKPVRAGEELVVSYSTHYARTVEEASNKRVERELSRISARSFVPSQTVAYRRPPPPLREPPLLLDLLPTIPTLPNFLPDEQGSFSVMCKGFGAIKQLLFCFRSLLPVGYGYSSTRTG